MYAVALSDNTVKELREFEKHVQKRILASLERVCIRPEAYLARLVGDDCYKLRVGDYRVLIDIDAEKNILFVTKIGHRKKVYDV